MEAVLKEITKKRKDVYLKVGSKRFRLRKDGKKIQIAVIGFVKEPKPAHHRPIDDRETKEELEAINSFIENNKAFLNMIWGD